MSKRISTTVSDVTYDAILAQAANDGQASTPDHGKGYVVRKALRAWLNKCGHSAELLNQTDDEYQNRAGGPFRIRGTYLEKDSSALPGIETTHEEVIAHE